MSSQVVHPGRTRIMGVLNVTPDSFSDGGLFDTVETAVAHARVLTQQGAHIIDVGGESTRPGASRVTPEEEQRRVLPVVAALVQEGLTVSVDTVNASTAERAIAFGASIINDVSGGTEDSKMLDVVAGSDVHYIAMHWRGVPDVNHNKSRYSDVVLEVRDQLARIADAALAAGVRPELLVLDPGFGFDKTAEQSFQLLANLSTLQDLGFPLLVGVSRKRMIAQSLQDAGIADTIEARDQATAALSALVARSGVWGVRVHNVAATAAALASVDSLGSSDHRDRIALTGLEVFAHHGVFESEKQQGQLFVIDAEIALDLSTAGHGDTLADTVNYADLATALTHAASREPVDLIETLAERLAAVALGFTGVSWASITVHKPQAPIDAVFSDVSVSITRSRHVESRSVSDNPRHRPAR